MHTYTSSTLTAKQRRELETELRRERTRLERTLDTVNPVRSASDEVWSGATVASRPRSHDAAVGVMLGNRTQARYDAVVAALARVETAMYGLCATCTQPIPFGRLIVMPEATHCVRCGGHQ